MKWLPLESLQRPPFGEMGIKTERIEFPLIDQEIINLSSADVSPLYNSYQYSLGQTEFARRGGPGTGASVKFFSGPPFNQKESYNSGFFIHFPITVPKNIAAQFLFSKGRYNVERTVVPASDRVNYRINSLNEDVATILNAGSQAFLVENLSTQPIGIEEDEGLIESLNFVWVPELAESVLNPDVYQTLDNSEFQPWRRSLQPETYVDGNTVDVEQRIQELFPYPDNPTPEQTAKVDEQRAWARRFALTIDWENEKRAFDPAVLRQGEIPDWGLVRLPSFEALKSYSVRKDKLREDALKAYGDFIFLGWQEIPEDQKNIRVMCRLRWPQQLRLPTLTAANFGFPPELEQVYVEGTYPAQFVPSPAPTFYDSLRQGAWIIDTNAFQPQLAQYQQNTDLSAYPGIEIYPTVFYNTYFNLQVQSWLATGDISWSGKLPSEWFEEGNLQYGGYDLIANYAILAPSAEEASKLGPPCLRLASTFRTNAGNGNYEVTIFKVPNEVDESGKPLSFKYVVGSKSCAQPLYLDALDAFATWATGFYCNPASYSKVGEYQWKIAGVEQPVAKIDLYGHPQFYTSFNCVVTLSS